MGSFVSLLPRLSDETPTQAFQQGQQNAANLAATQQRTAMEQAQTQGAQLQNQQGQNEFKARQAFNHAMQGNVVANPDGSFGVNYDGVVKSMNQGGYGSYTGTYMQPIAQMQVHHAQMIGAMLDNEGKAAEQIGQLANGASTQDAWTHAAPQIRSVLKSVGEDPSFVTDTFDPALRQQIVDGAQKVGDFTTQARLAAELKLHTGENLVKNYGEFDSLVNNNVAQTRNPTELDAVRGQAQAIVNDASRQGVPWAQSLQDRVNRIPTTWSADVPQQALLSNTPAAQQPKTEQEIRSNQVAPLYAAPSPAQYQATLDNLPHGIATQLPAANQAFNADGTRNEQVLDRVRLFGESPEQQGMEAYRTGMVGVRKQQADISQQRADTAQDRVDAYQQYLNGRTGGNGAPGITPGQQGVQNRFNQKEMDRLESQEDQARNQRDDLRNTIQTGTFIASDGSVKELPTNSTAPYQSRLRQVETTLQNTQYRKAAQFGVASPDPKQAAGVAEGGSVTAPDGAVWRKRDGILYVQPKAQPQTAAPAAAPKPTSSPRTYTEAEVRAAAAKAGQNPDWAVQQARLKGLVQ